MEPAGIESLQRGNDRRAAVKPGGGGMGDVENEIAAAIVIVADKGGACRHALHNPDKLDIHAVLRQPVDNDLPKGVVPDRADKDAVGARPRRLINENAGRSGRKWALIGFNAPMAAILADSHDLDKQVADAADARARHVIFPP
jgi:hypothetical protein